MHDKHDDDDYTRPACSSTRRPSVRAPAMQATPRYIHVSMQLAVSLSLSLSIAVSFLIDSAFSRRVLPSASRNIHWNYSSRISIYSKNEFALRPETISYILGDLSNNWESGTFQKKMTAMLASFSVDARHKAFNKS